MINMSIKLKKFDIASMPDGYTCALLAKRMSGKSFLIRELMYHKREYPAGVVIAPTDSMTHCYSKFVPNIFIHYEYKQEILTKLFLRQQALADENEERIKAGKKTIDSRAFVIMDDCLSSKGEWIKDPNIAEIFYNGRHRNITFLMSMQFPLGIKPEFRTNLDYIFLLAEDNYSNQKRLYEHYAGCFPSFELFRKVFIEVTENYGCLVIDNRSRSSDITKKCFWYRANDPGDFFVGGDKARKYNQKYYDPNWNKRRKPFDIQDYLKRKNKVHVDIELEDDDDADDNR